MRYVVTFFITGDRANAMAKINPSERIEMAFKQFVGITLRTNDAKEFDRIRKTRLKTSATKVWAEDKFAGGSYTHPSVGCTAKTRADLAKPEWSNTLFFCGEATNTSVNPCLQGAFETGALQKKYFRLSKTARKRRTRRRKNVQSLLLSSSSSSSSCLLLQLVLKVLSIALFFYRPLLVLVVVLSYT